MLPSFPAGPTGAVFQSHSPKGTIMTDIAPPGPAAEAMSLGDAAQAFKVHLGQGDAPPDRLRDEQGRFAGPAEGGPGEAEIVLADEDDPDARDDAARDGDWDAATEAGPEPDDAAQADRIAPPASWSAEDAGVWGALPPAVQAKIARHEERRDAAVHAKFQEAAEVRQANQALISAAHASREQAVTVIDHLAHILTPQRPPSSMLNPQSGDFNPDAYHLLNAEYFEGVETLQALGQQRQQLAAQHDAEVAMIEREAMEEIERVSRPGLIADVPDLADDSKRPAILNALVDYAIAQHIPADTFSPENAWRVSSAELRILWKASQYDLQQAARARIRSDPRPEPRKPQPVVRPGVPTPRAAREQANFNGSMERLSREGSVEAGAAVFKHFMKAK